nr:hypothetical protein CFP56_38130 [Quercus suber]
MDRVGWVKLLDREMKNASNEDDAIARGSRVFDASDSSIHAIANTGINQLMEQGEKLLQEYIILKQTMAIQQQEHQKEREERKLEHETLLQEYMIVKQLVTQYQFGLRTLKSQNERRLSGVSQSGMQLTFGALQLWAEFLAANERDMLSGSAIQSLSCLVLVVAALCRKLEVPLSPIKAESKALEAGILFALCRGCLAVVLEGDSQVLINALMGSSPAPSAMVSVIEGILELCKGFSQFQFSHVKRQGNMSAHLVAKNAYSIVNDIVWVEEDPCFAKQALIHDVNFMVS